MKKIFILILLMCFIWGLSVHLIRTQNEIKKQEQRIQDLQAANRLLEKQLDLITEQQTDVINSLKKWLDEWEVMMSEVTGYAPLDPEAVEGHDYEGNPGITASGEKVILGKTAAGPPDIKFGKIVYFPKRGDRRVIQDRGGRIQCTVNREPQFDLAVATKKEAQKIGRTKELVVVQK